MKLTHLRDIIAAAELGSLRAAARHLGIAQPSITRSIREVEQELGVPLFERHQQGVRLTAMGDAFLKRAVAVQSELRRAREEIDQLGGQLVGEVSVAMSGVSSLALMPKAVRTFRAKYPAAQLKITEAFFHAVEAQVLNGQIDFCVGPFREVTNEGRLIVEKLFDHEWVVISRKGHPLAQCRTLAELVDAEWVRPALAERANEAYIARPFLDEGLMRPNVVMNTTSATTTLVAVANSDLLTILPRSMLSPPIDSALFSVLDIAEKMQGTQICLIRRTGMPLTPLAEYFADMIKRTALAINPVAP
ncbi:LysR substrate-binding domain-containing protein [Mesobacterium pallidum]|uniref:LysR substrate-binding domain-containing protein n=1 Tax=Mesobacterium pallidum TaxID=2872037 RepID=UPI001EE32EAB|nr:LysR substrate-binding domain-containing protein [Mesobacterium pallidum]